MKSNGADFGAHGVGTADYGETHSPLTQLFGSCTP